MRFLYSTGVVIYGLALRILSLFNQKARDWFYGRSQLYTKLEEVFAAHYAADNPSPVIWIHCASLGEFEQGRPIIQEIKQTYPNYFILLTFFSPSGYKNKAASTEADCVLYLPLDTPSNARKFIRTVSPAMAIFVKYEFWYNYLHQLHMHNIPALTVSAIFRPEQHFFRWFGGWFRTHLRNLNHIFVQDQQSAELLRLIDINNVTVSGDTRFDRVTRIMQQAEELPAIARFCGNNTVLVAGSTWPPDEVLLKKAYTALQGKLKMIIAPHEISTHHMDALVADFGNKAVRYSEYIKPVGSQFKPSGGYDILIIDSIGLLSRIYRYGKIAYIGGGFGVGIHNTLEAAVYGLPVLYGPNYQRFREAHDLINVNAAVSIKDAGELTHTIASFIEDPAKQNAYSAAASDYVSQRTGATDIVMNYFNSHIKESVRK